MRRHTGLQQVVPSAAVAIGCGALIAVDQQRGAPLHGDGHPSRSAGCSHFSMNTPAEREKETLREREDAAMTGASSLAPALVIPQPHERPETMQVSTSALLQLLYVLTGPLYAIRDLQVNRGSHIENPIDTLIREFNAQIEANRSQFECPASTPSPDTHSKGTPIA